MEQKVQQLYQELEQVCLTEIAHQCAEAENRHEQMTSELAGFAQQLNRKSWNWERNVAMQMQSSRMLQMQLHWEPSKEQTKRFHRLS